MRDGTLLEGEEDKSPWKRKRLGRNYVPLRERFPMFYDNTDGRFYDKIRPDYGPMTI